MHNRRPTYWATLLLVVAFAFSGCAPRSGAGSTAASLADSDLIVDLPAIAINIAEDGTAAVGNVPVAQLGRLVGLDLSALSVPQSWVDFLKSGNIQHIQVDNTSGGLLLLVNGEPIPSIAYDGNSLSATAEALSSLGIAVPMLDRLLPMVDKLGMGVVVRFPVAEGQAAIPLYVNGNGSTAAVAQQAQQEFLTRVGVPPRINLPVFYAADGSWKVGNLTDAEWTALTGQPFYALRLNPTVVKALAANGVAELSISTNTKGIQIGVNGNMLPTITWSNGELQHLLNVADQLGVLDQVAPGMNMNEVLATVNNLLPLVTATDFDLTVHMPDSAVATR